MKNKNWIWITLTVIVVLGLIAGGVVLAYRAGLRSAAALPEGKEQTLPNGKEQTLPNGRELMPGMRNIPNGFIFRHPALFGFAFLFPLRLLFGLAVLLLVVWLVVKVARAAWNGGNHKSKPAEATVSPVPTETVINQTPTDSSASGEK